MAFGQVKPIVGGQAVGSPHAFPFAAHLRIETQPGWHAVCGGTWISDRHVVTAAHCLHNAPTASAITIGYGNTEIGQMRRTDIRNFHIHPQFNPRTLSHDIAVIEAQDRVGTRIPVYFGPIQARDPLITMGWGVTSNTPGAHTAARLNQVELAVADTERCQRVDEKFTSSNGPFVCTDTQPGNRDECGGDSGSPAVMSVGGELRLAALTSYGDNLQHDSHPPCGDPTGFGFSTHVGFYQQFLTATTGLARQQLEAPVAASGINRNTLAGDSKKSSASAGFANIGGSQLSTYTLAILGVLCI